MTAKGDVLDKIIEWRLGDPRFSRSPSRALRRHRKRICVMQVQFVIEMRVDFPDDPEKTELMQNEIAAAARFLKAKASLLGGQKAQVVMFSDDFYLGHKDISLMDDVITDALESHGQEETKLSSELAEALRDEANEGS